MDLDLVIQCCACHKYRIERGKEFFWVWCDNLKPKKDITMVSHGYCPDCTKEIREQIAREQKEIQNENSPTCA